MKTASQAGGPPAPDERQDAAGCIEAANRLLRTLGAPEPGDPRFLRFALEQRVGQEVEARVGCRCEQRPRTFAGKVRMAGRDFLELTCAKEEVLIPYRRLCVVRWELGQKGPAPQGDARASLDLDPLLRRRLILRFGEVVAADEALMQRFFGIPLRRRLEDFLGRAVQVQTDRTGGLPRVYGVLTAVGDGMELRSGKRVDRVDFEEICYLRI